MSKFEPQQGFNILFYYIEESVLLGTNLLVDSIRHFIRDPSGVFSYVTFRSMTSRFRPFVFVELVSPYNKKNITRWLEDMNFMFSWQEQYLTSERSERVRYCSCHENIKFISSSHRVMFFLLYLYTSMNLKRLRKFTFVLGLRLNVCQLRSADRDEL